MTYFLIPVITAIILAILARFFPLKDSNNTIGITSISKKEERKYSIFALLGVFPFILIIAFFGLFFMYFLPQVDSFIFDSEKLKYTYSLRSQNGVSIVIGCLLGIGSSMYLMDYLYLLLMGRNNFEKFNNYHAKRIGINEKAGRFIFILFTTLAIITSVLRYNWYIKIPTNSDKILFNNFMSLKENEYPIDEIEAINHYEYLTAPNGNIVHRPIFEIKMTDDYIWDTQYSMSVPDSTFNSFIKYLSKKSGKDISYIKTKY